MRPKVRGKRIIFSGPSGSGKSTIAQHFLKEDRHRLQRIHNKIEVLWGIPLYSSLAQEHDGIVKKPGAFDTLLENLYVLASSGGAIELRTVLMKKNITVPKLLKNDNYEQSYKVFKLVVPNLTKPICWDQSKIVQILTTFF